MTKTDVVLLRSLSSNDAKEADWRIFVEKYYPIAYAYGKSSKLDDASSSDLAQEVMITMLRALKGFVYDPGRGKFRSYFNTILRRSYLNYVRRAQPWEELDETREQIPSEDEVDSRWRLALIEDCLIHISKRCKTRDVEIFRRVKLEEQKAHEVAKEFGLERNHVYQITRRIQGHLEEELRECIEL